MQSIWFDKMVDFNNTTEVMVLKNMGLDYFEIIGIFIGAAIARILISIQKIKGGKFV